VFGSEKNIRHNLRLFFIDGIVFMPAMTLISITTVIPYFLEQLGASTLQIAMAASMAMVCTFITQPLFGSLASRARELRRTFGKILLTQRTIFLVFVLCIPLFSANPPMLTWMFLAFWGVFNIFVGSYNVFYTSLLMKLLPPEKRGAVRGAGFAIGSGLGVAMAALIPMVLSRVVFPYNFVLIFSIGILFLLVNGTLFLLMKEHEDIESREPMGIVQYIKGFRTSILSDVPFRTLILTSTFLVIANSLLPFYTVYAIRIFSATESNVATLAALAVVSNAIGFIVFGLVIDRRGPFSALVIAACMIISAAIFALVTNTLILLFVAWVLANLGATSYGMTASLMLGEVTPAGKLPLYVGVLTTISLATSSAVLLLLAPTLEHMGFAPLFLTVLICGAAGLFASLFILRKHLVNKHST